jgi:hypothetical protein
MPMISRLPSLRMTRDCCDQDIDNDKDINKHTFHVRDNARQIER